MSKLGSLVRERILILDGAMGTMIQQYNLTEEDFRGERFSQIPGQMKGNNDLLCLTRPDVNTKTFTASIWRSGADIIETKYIQFHPRQYGRLSCAGTMCVR